MKDLNDLIKYLKNRNVNYKFINSQVIINRYNYDYNLINKIRETKNQIDVSNNNLTKKTII